MRLPLALIPASTVVRVRAGPNKGARWRVGSSVHGCWLGTYEAAKARVLSAAVKPGMTAWDVGANAGYYTLLFSRSVGRSGRVVAFEPFAENARSLLDHVGWNGCTNTKVVQAAVADRIGISGFEIAHLSGSMVHLSSAAQAYLVPTITLDSCARSQGFSVPDVVKMDVEGAEVAVLRGSPEILQARRTTWYISLHGAAARSGCDELLRAAGYRLLSLEGEPLRPQLEGFVGDEIVAVPAAP